MISGCGQVTGVFDASPVPALPGGFPEMPYPPDNPPTIAGAHLGRKLFFETSLSKQRTISCASCHKPEDAFADRGNAFSQGEGGKTERNAPTLTNVGYLPHLFWEGGVTKLEAQAIGPITNPIEMNMRADTLVRRLQAMPEYAPLFLAAYCTPEITFERVLFALSTFQRTLVSSDSPFDRYQNGDKNAMSPAALRGLELFFNEEGDCFHCHGGFNFTDNLFHNNGLDAEFRDEGRYRITQNDADLGKFKTPTLRNLSFTGPYMHDGRFQTLEQVVRHYNSGGVPSKTRSPLMRPLHLSESDIQALVAFLEALSDSGFVLRHSNHRQQ
jgi:cytochrome c peroxidase